MSGLLNLHEAAYLRVHGEHKLEDALAFTTDNLKSMAPNLSNTHGKQVAHALEQCIHFGNPRIETRNFLSIYQEDEFKNEMLLRFAKLDCNSLQMLHKNELCEVSRRDISEINQLPEYIKPFYSALLNLYEQFDEELLKEGSFYAVHYAKEALKEHVRMWKSSGSSKDTCHLFSVTSNALITCTYVYNTTASLLRIKSLIEEEFEWVSDKPKMLVANLIICQLIDDIATYEVEKERGQTATGNESYMKENGVTKEVVVDKFFEMVTNLWKDINEECLRPTSSQRNFDANC